MNKKILLYVILFCFLAAYASADLITGEITLVINSSGFDFETQQLSNTNYDIKLTNKIHTTGCWGPYNLAFNATSSNGVAGIGGSQIVLNETYEVSNKNGQFQNYISDFPLCGNGDVVALYTVENNYTIFKVTNINNALTNVTISYILQNNGSTKFFNRPTTGCYGISNETSCMAAQKSGQPCWWDFGTQMCKENKGADMGGKIVDCFLFDSMNKTCPYINVCYWDNLTRWCEKNTSAFNPSTGILCGNITNMTTCNNIPVLKTFCSWNQSSNKCQENSSKTKNDVPTPPVTTCEQATGNASLCWSLISDYFMPCGPPTEGAICGLSADAMFGGGMSQFFDINTEESCNAAGGDWITESYSYTDSYGNQKTGTDSWCEMGFGNEDCDDMCWACEDSVSLARGNTTTQARTVCENSSLGFCNFKADSNAWNGLGWCEMKPEMMNGGGNCNSNCFDCEFLINPASACNSSTAGCKWVTDQGTNRSWCEKANAKICSNDCFQCYDTTSCTQYGKGVNGSCTWDSTLNLCKPSGYSNEICFDGTDNDNDFKIDCGDPDCGFDSFCGGTAMDTNNCGSKTTATCGSTEGCVWINDTFDQKYGASGHCGRQGENCWMFEDSGAICNQTAGCTWRDTSYGFCEINNSIMSICMGKNTSVQCNSTSSCVWRTDNYGGGWCDFSAFECHKYTSNATCSPAAEGCSWIVDKFSQGVGHCEPFCFGFNQQQCNANSSCEYKTGMCEPDMFASNCKQHSGNRNNCQNQSACTWFSDPQGSGSGVNQGFCEDKFMVKMMEGMEEGQPVMLGNDQLNEVEPSYCDIMGFGLKDTKKSYYLGIPVRQQAMDYSVLCYNEQTPQGLGAGKNTTKFYWYLDTDGNTTNNCNSSDNSSTGFEFFFKYLGTWDTTTSTAQESKLSYKCNNGTWGPVPIPISTRKKEMCIMMGGGIVMLDKEALKKFKSSGFFNETKPIRIYAATANASRDESTPIDTIGPAYYTPGSIDFKMEDCLAPGQDMDGDGFVSENDPDCQQFKKLGYIPKEEGPSCKDGTDNDVDGVTDCDDQSCKYDPFFCGGNLSAQSSDKTAPQIVLHTKKTFPDMAEIIFGTDKPTNNSFEFYRNDSTCSTLNKTLTYSVFRTSHSALLNNDSLGYHLTSNNTYHYKIKVCDPSDNCAKSGCTNLTTRAGADENNCPQCQFSVGFKFEPQSGLNNTNPLGNLTLAIDLESDGDWDIQNDTMQYARQVNYSDGKNSTIKFTNPTSSQSWSIALKGVDLVSPITAQKASGTTRTKGAGNLSDEFKYNTSGENKFIGMASDKFKTILENFGVEEIELTIPDTGNSLYHCDENNLSKCADISNEAGVSKLNQTSNSSTWKIPVRFGMGFSVYTVVGGETYNLTFTNISAINLTVTTTANATYLINLTNNNNVTRVYNITANSTPSTWHWINGSSMLQVNISANRTVTIQVKVFNNTAGLYNTTIWARLYNDSTVLLNSTDDFGYIRTNVSGDSTSPVVNAVVPYLVNPETTNYTNFPVTFIVNVTEANIDKVWYIINTLNSGAGLNDTQVLMSGCTSANNCSINISLNFSTNYTGPGPHSVYFCANDTSGNKDCNTNLGGLAAGYIIKGANVTQIETRFAELGLGTANITYENYTDLPENVMADPTSYNMTMILNRTDSSGYNIFGEIVGMSIDENKMKNMTNSNMSIAISDPIRNAVGSDLNISATSWMDVSSFLPAGASYKYGRIRFPVNFNWVYYCNSTITNPICYRVSECLYAVNYSNYTAITATNEKACYRTENNADVLYVDQFSGGTGANDTTGPTFLVATTTNNTATITLNWSVNDTSNVTYVGYYLDDLATLFNLNASNNSVIIRGTKEVNFSAGVHTLKFTANDTLNNTANSSTLRFTVTIQENVTLLLNKIQNSVGANILTNITLKEGATDWSSNVTSLNKTIMIEMTLNGTNGQAAWATIRNFTGTDANWNMTDRIKVERNTTSFKGSTITQRAGSNLTNVILFQNLSKLLSSSGFISGATIIFNQSITSNHEILYISDDEGDSIYKLSYCSSIPNSTINTSNMCYSNSSTNVTLYIPYFSGGGIASDTVAPTINITNPVNNTVKNNSYFTFTFDVWETNPNSSFCIYNFSNSSQKTVTSGSLTASQASHTSGTSLYSYSVSSGFSSLNNQNYNITVNCTDLKNQSSFVGHNFSVNDITAPVISSISSSGATSTTTSGTLTISITVDEKASCWYGSASGRNATNVTGLTAISTGINTTSQSFDISYTADGTLGPYYITCRDLSINNMTYSNSTGSITVDVGTTTTSTGGGGGGVSGVAANIKDKISKMWNQILAGETITMLIDKVNIAFTKIDLTVKNTRYTVNLKVSSLIDKPSEIVVAPDKVYQYLELSPTNIASSDISKAIIEFRVTISWINENKIDKETIKLNRYNVGWQELTTTKIKEDNSYVYYRAETPGFSYYAITGKEFAAKEEAVSEIPKTEEAKPEEAAKVEEAPEVPLKEKVSKAWLGWLIVGIAIIIVVVGIIRVRKKKTE